MSGQGNSVISPWFILGIEENSRPEIVRSAYRRAVFRYHPDSSGPEADPARFAQAVSAYRQIKELVAAATNEDIDDLRHVRRTFKQHGPQTNNAAHTAPPRPPQPNVYQAQPNPTPTSQDPDRFADWGTPPQDTQPTVHPDSSTDETFVLPFDYLIPVLFVGSIIGRLTVQAMIDMPTSVPVIAIVGASFVATILLAVFDLFFDRFKVMILTIIWLCMFPFFDYALWAVVPCIVVLSVVISMVDRRGNQTENDVLHTGGLS